MGTRRFRICRSRDFEKWLPVQTSEDKYASPFGHEEGDVQNKVASYNAIIHNDFSDSHDAHAMIVEDVDGHDGITRIDSQIMNKSGDRILN